MSQRGRRDRSTEEMRGFVLVVEDEEAVRTLVSRYLQKYGFSVHSAADGQEALDFLAECGEPPRVLVSDVVMPRMDGPSLAKALRPRFPSMPILFMSGYVDDKFAIPGLERDSYRFLAKPFSLAKLLAIVEELLEEESGERQACRQGG